MHCRLQPTYCATPPFHYDMCPDRGENNSYDSYMYKLPKIDSPAKLARAIFISSAYSFRGKAGTSCISINSGSNAIRHLRMCGEMAGTKTVVVLLLVAWFATLTTGTYAMCFAKGTTISQSTVRRIAALSAYTIQVKLYSITLSCHS